MKTMKHCLEKLKKTKINEEIYPFSWFEKLDIMMSVLPKLNYGLHVIPVKFPASFLCHIRNSPVDSQIMWKFKGSGIAKIVWGKGGKLGYWQCLMSKLFWCYSNLTLVYQLNRKENLDVDLPPRYGRLIFDKAKFNVGKDSSIIKQGQLDIHLEKNELWSLYKN